MNLHFSATYLFFQIGTSTLTPQFEVSGFVPTGRSCAAGMALDEYLVVFGGTTADSQFSDMFVFDTVRRMWRSCSLPFEMDARRGHSAVPVRLSLLT